MNVFVVVDSLTQLRCIQSYVYSCRTVSCPVSSVHHIYVPANSTRNIFSFSFVGIFFMLVQCSHATHSYESAHCAILLKRILWEGMWNWKKKKKEKQFQCWLISFKWLIWNDCDCSFCVGVLSLRRLCSNFIFAVRLWFNQYIDYKRNYKLKGNNWFCATIRVPLYRSRIRPVYGNRYSAGWFIIAFYAVVCYRTLPNDDTFFSDIVANHIVYKEARVRNGRWINCNAI